MGIVRIKEFLGSSLCIMALCCLLALGGCDGDDANYDPGAPASFDTVVGPEGDVIEVTDPESDLHGLKIVIPEGALAASTTITVTAAWNAPALPAGYESGYPLIELTPDGVFQKAIQIVFPYQDSVENSEKMFCAFYWDRSDASDAKWQVVTPESLTSNKMTIQTQHFSLWRWGELNLDEMEPETLNSLVDEMFGPNYIDRVEAAFEEAFEAESPNVIDWSMAYCANRIDIGNFINSIKDDAAVRAEEEYMPSINAVCQVWDDPPEMVDIFSGFKRLVDIHLQYLGESIAAEGISLVPFVGGIASIFAKAAAQAAYEQRLSNLKDDYACIFAEADSELWVDFGLYTVAYGALVGMQFAEEYHYCD